MVLQVREQDKGWLAELLDAKWHEMLAREGRAPMPPMAMDAPELACPACGNAAPLVKKCCSDCGLRLA